MKIDVIKRNGDAVPFDRNKIIAAIKKAYDASDIEDNMNVAKTIADKFYNLVSACKDIEIKISIDTIQEFVEDSLMKSAPYKVAKKYIIYRDLRDKARYDYNKLATTYHDIIDIKDNNIKKSNANVNGNTPAGQMMIFASEASKDYTCNYLLSPKYAKAHKDGWIHIHDLDYYTTKAANCNQLDLKNLFSKDQIITNDSVIRRPKRIGTFSALAAIALQSSQNEMFGGQSIHSWDYAMADGVRDTFKRLFKEANKDYFDYTGIDFINNNKLKDEYLKIGSFIVKEAPFYERVYTKVIEEVHEAMAAFIYNCCSMHARGGGQVVFSSINYGTDTSDEGRIIIEQTLKAIEEGLGDGSTAIFPISVFRVKTGINYSDEDWATAQSNWQDAVSGKVKFKTLNFDLFLRACEVSAKRLFPNFLFLDSTFNQNPLWQEEKTDRYKYELSCMGCRTRVYDNRFGEKTCIGRGNLSFTTINIVRLAIEAKKYAAENCKANTAQEFETYVLRRFYELLDEYLELTSKQLYDRYKWQCSAKAKQFPFIMRNDLLKGGQELNQNDHIEEVLKHGTLSIGFIGLAEALKEMLGYHHGESEHAQKIGLEIISHMREFTDKKSDELNLNYSLFATPAEGLSGRFTMIDKERYGIIEGVTDRDFYTNSNHVPVYYKISAYKKIQIEAPYHTLTNAGHILYVELGGDTRRNVLGFATIIVEMLKNNAGYGTINHTVDRCMECGYEGVIDNNCPKCGEKFNIDRIRRITGYLVGTTDRWNSFKLAELEARTKHN